MPHPPGAEYPSATPDHVVARHTGRLVDDDKAGIVHCTIGKATFEVNALKENLSALIADLQKAKPATSKGVYLKRVTLSSTMGPGVIVDQGSL